MQITIRKIEPVDAEILSSLAKQTFYDTFVGTCADEDMESFLEEYFNVDRVKKELEETASFNYFAEINNEPIGYIRFKENKEFPYLEKYKTIELKRLYVSKGFHGKGVAQRLMELFAEHVKQNKYEAMLLSVWEYNFKAQNFYKKYGFEDSGHDNYFPIGKTPQTDRWYWKFLKE